VADGGAGKAAKECENGSTKNAAHDEYVIRIAVFLVSAVEIIFVCKLVQEVTIVWLKVPE